MGGVRNQAEGLRKLNRMWRKVLELLIIADGSVLRTHAQESPLQLRFFLQVMARVCETVKANDNIHQYDRWLENCVCPSLVPMLHL